jgi:hypothetical protein
MQPVPAYKTEPVPIEIQYNGKTYQGHGIPVSESCKEGVCFELDITLNNQHLGRIHCTDAGWRMDGVEQGLVNALGEEITAWYE